MDRKRLLIAVAFLVGIIAVGVALYAVFFRRAPIPAPPTPPPVTPGEPIPLPPLTNVAPPLPTTGIAPPQAGAPSTVPAPPTPTVAAGDRTTATALSTTAATFVRLNASGRPQYYSPLDGRFYRVGADGRASALSEQEFRNVRSATWAPGGDRAIIEFPDGANVLYDFASGAQVTLPQHWTAFSFAPRGERIAGMSMALDRENRYLFESDPNGNAFRAIAPLGNNADKVTVAWSPNNQVVAFSRTGITIGDGRQNVLAVGRNGENFPALVVEGQDFRPLWSPDGTRIVYSAVRAEGNYNPELWVVGGTGTTLGAGRQLLRVSTWADKCTFADAATLYCAIPDALKRGYGLEPVLAERVPDSIERIDLTTGIRTTVGRPASDTSIAQLSVAPDGGSLFYVARTDGRLYEMRLR